jgi:iron complex transport system ATP-binding protein
MIEATGLALGYRNSKVLSGVDLSIRAGSLGALIGANGSGKSTLLRCLAGLHAPSAGSLRGAATLPGRERRKVLAYLPQRLPEAAAIRVRDWVLLGADGPRRWRVSAAACQRADDALTAMGLNGFERRLCNELSGGEFRRAAVAATLAQGAPLLLLDEPCSGLDLPHASALMRRLRRWIDDEPQQRGALLVLHDLNAVAQWCDRALLLGDGLLLADGDPQEVLASDTLERAYKGRLQRFRHPQADHLVILGTGA